MLLVHQAFFRVHPSRQRIRERSCIADEIQMSVNPRLCAPPVRFWTDNFHCAGIESLFLRIPLQPRQRAGAPSVSIAAATRSTLPGLSAPRNDLLARGLLEIAGLVHRESSNLPDFFQNTSPLMSTVASLTALRPETIETADHQRTRALYDEKHERATAVHLQPRAIKSKRA